MSDFRTEIRALSFPHDLLHELICGTGPEKLDQTVRLVTRTRKTHHSYLGLYIGHTYWNYMWFSSVPPGNHQDSVSGYVCFLWYPFQFINRYHPTIHCYTVCVVKQLITEQMKPGAENVVMAIIWGGRSLVVNLFGSLIQLRRWLSR
jgi:hypothetical protein